MKVIKLLFVLQAALLATFFADAAQADDAAKSAHSKQPPYSKQALQNKIEYCLTCHGPNAEGARGAFPIPRLAGQQVKYLENQLRYFILHQRQNNIMSNAVHEMGSAEMTAIATYFNGLDPKPLGGAPKEPVAAGKKIYEEGIPQADVPACLSCHGPEAKGAGAFPRLASQLNDYISSKLAGWEKDRGKAPAAPGEAAATMKAVAHRLTDTQVAAVAAYLSYLE
jgi:cytochrome c553